jgi:hypothetical protein
MVLAGCDSSGGLDEDTDLTVSPQETAESIAVSLAESTGGTAGELADAVAIAGGEGAVSAKAISRSRECTYDDTEQTWTCVVEVSGSRGRVETLDFDRTYEVQFFSEGTEVRFPADADSLTFQIVRGSGVFETERINNSHELRPATWSLGDNSNGTYTVQLLSEEAGRDVTEQFEGAVRVRTRDATVRKTRTDGLVLREGERLVAGTIEGSYEADVEIERANGETVSRSVSVTYVATFSEEGAEVAFTGGGERFTGESFMFNLATGELQ